MTKKEKELPQEVSPGDSFVPTELGSARWVSADAMAYSRSLNARPGGDAVGTPGPPWGVAPSMNSVCGEAGIDYRRFIDCLRDNRSDAEMAQEFGVGEQTISALREHFYRAEAIHGNYGQD